MTNDNTEVKSTDKILVSSLSMVLIGLLCLCLGIAIGIMLSGYIQNTSTVDTPKLGLPPISREDIRISPIKPDADGQKFCTMEVLTCPDGSFVGRQGPNCEFAPCPTILDSIEKPIQTQLDDLNPGSGFGEDPSGSGGL